MTKGRSNHTFASDDFSLPKAKILRGRKNFQRLFERDVHIIRKKNVDLRYLIVDKESFGCLMGFIVKKRLGKANKRNRMKRLLKEAYRKHQHILTMPLQKAQWTFHGVLMAKKIDVGYAEVEESVTALLCSVQDQLSTIISPGHS
ncbi:MAG: ribonuclease P protein component [Bacteroidota bacterium]